MPETNKQTGKAAATYWLKILIIHFLLNTGTSDTRSLLKPVSTDNSEDFAVAILSSTNISVI